MTIPDDQGNLPTPQCILDEARFEDGDYTGYAVICIVDHEGCTYMREMFRTRRQG